MEVLGAGVGAETLAGATREGLSDKMVFVQNMKGESCAEAVLSRLRDWPVPRPWGGICLARSVRWESWGE